MNMTNKRLIKTVCPIIALFFFFATISPGIVRAQANEDGGNANSLYMLKVAIAAKKWNCCADGRIAQRSQRKSFSSDGKFI
jgi:hypothetical protein